MDDKVGRSGAGAPSGLRPFGVEPPEASQAEPLVPNAYRVPPIPPAKGGHRRTSVREAHLRLLAKAGPTGVPVEESTPSKGVIRPRHACKLVEEGAANWLVPGQSLVPAPKGGDAPCP
jgi:hypothetical protein